MTAVHSGVADASPYINEALASGRTVELAREAYIIKSRLDIVACGTGIIGNGARLIMATEPGAFDNTSTLNTARFGPRGCGITANGVSGAFVRDLSIAPDAVIDGRFVKALAFKLAADFKVERIEAWGFTRSGALFDFNDCERGLIDLIDVHDLWTAATAGQITAIGLDGSGLVDSKHIDITRCRVRNVNAPLTFDTTAVHLEGRGGRFITVKDCRLSDVKQGIDSYAREVSIKDNLIIGATVHGIALKHGAGLTEVTGNKMIAIGKNALKIEGSNVAGDSNLDDILVEGNVVRGVNTNALYTGTENTSCLSYSSGAAGSPKGLKVRGNVFDGGGTAKFGIYGGKGAVAELWANDIRGYRVEAVYQLA